MHWVKTNLNGVIHMEHDFKDYPLPNIWIKSNNIGVLEWIDDNYVISCLFEGMMESFNSMEVAS